MANADPFGIICGTFFAAGVIISILLFIYFRWQSNIKERIINKVINNLRFPHRFYKEGGLSEKDYQSLFMIKKSKNFYSADCLSGDILKDRNFKLCRLCIEKISKTAYFFKIIAALGGSVSAAPLKTSASVFSSTLLLFKIGVEVEKPICICSNTDDATEFCSYNNDSALTKTESEEFNRLVKLYAEDTGHFNKIWNYSFYKKCKSLCEYFKEGFILGINGKTISLVLPNYCFYVPPKGLFFLKRNINKSYERTAQELEYLIDIVHSQLDIS